jgi:hypothetical protein
MVYYNTDIKLYAYVKKSITTYDGGLQRHLASIFYFVGDTDVVIQDFFVMLSMFFMLVVAVWLILGKFWRHFPDLRFLGRIWFLHLICWFLVLVVAMVKLAVYLTSLHQANISEQDVKLLSEVSADYLVVRNLLATLLFLINIRVSVLAFNNSDMVTLRFIIVSLR